VTGDASVSAAALAGAAPVSAPAATAPAQDVSGPAAPQAPGYPSPASQLSAHIAPLRQEADGTHRLTVHLSPDDLGQVSLVAEVRDGTIHLELNGATEAGREALRHALPELREELNRAGFGNATLDLRQGGSDPGYHRSQPTRTQEADQRAESHGVSATAASDPVPQRIPDHNRLIDLHV
jgi:flagellar hook-length control protein FliK